MMARLTPDERKFYRDNYRKGVDLHPEIVHRLFNDIDVADEEIRQEQIAADSAQGELRRLRDTLGDLITSHDGLLRENNELRKALGTKKK